MLKLAILLMLVAAAAHGQVVVSQGAPSYLVFPTQAQAMARSQQQCQTLGCDGVKTIYWWNVVSLSNGSWAVQIQPSAPFGASVTVGPDTAGLSTAEAAALLTAAQLGSLLPAVSQQVQ
jgi:hypothetical protein